MIAVAVPGRGRVRTSVPAARTSLAGAESALITVVANCHVAGVRSPPDALKHLPCRNLVLRMAPDPGSRSSATDPAHASLGHPRRRYSAEIFPHRRAASRLQRFRPPVENQRTMGQKVVSK